jgi:hypothetical protein
MPRLPGPVPGGASYLLKQFTILINSNFPQDLVAWENTVYVILFNIRIYEIIGKFKQSFLFDKIKIHSYTPLY